jgi:hypothetical protein
MPVAWWCQGRYLVAVTVSTQAPWKPRAVRQPSAVSVSVRVAPLGATARMVLT